jgi:NAD(P)-dependent dehydrogenase (short-subunit alcohol dehydrogenase family)
VKLEGTAAIVTGGASGLGLATAIALATSGADVYAFDLAPSIESAPRLDGVTFIEIDVTSPEAVREGVAQATSGTQSLRAVVNCAGIIAGARILGPDGPHDLDLFARVVGVNLVGTFNVLSIGAEAIARTAADDNGQRGVIINTTSIAAYDGQAGLAAYAASKSGIVGLTLPAALDLAEHGIRVMAIAPGIFLTPMNTNLTREFDDGRTDKVPFPQRVGVPPEFASLVLAIIDNDYMNGEVIRIDGAHRMSARRT